MFSLGILTLVSVISYLYLDRIMNKTVLAVQADYRRISSEHDRLLQENIELKKSNLDLERTAEEITAIYNTTKDICKSLNIELIFGYFREQITKYIRIKDCKFIKDDHQLSQYKNDTLLPLKIDTAPIGYLVAIELNEEDKDKFFILAQQFLLGAKRALLYQKVQELAITDSLTQVFSRRYLMERFNEEFVRAKKFKYNLSFLMVDIDNFKEYNDRYGHLVGDAILMEVSKTIKESTRQVDLLGRYGGEEFSVILTETDKEGARLAAERIRYSVEHRDIKVYDENLRVTISIGISVFPDTGSSKEDIIENADSALYQAKQKGKNIICIYEKT